MHNRSICRADSCGNTFILIEGKGDFLVPSPKEIKALCTEALSSSVDGLLVFKEKTAPYTYSMQYFNCDGYPADLCGNGLASLALWIYELYEERRQSDSAPHPKSFTVESAKAQHAVHVGKEARVTCEMPSIEEIEEVTLEKRGLFVAKCGVPHLVVQGSSIENLKEDLEKYAALYRHHPHFGKRGGVNVNVVCLEEGSLYARTFERGVEGETKSCGTGASVCAFFAHKALGMNYPIDVHMPGGVLSVDKTKGSSAFNPSLELTTCPKLFSTVLPLC